MSKFNEHCLLRVKLTHQHRQQWKPFILLSLLMIMAVSVIRVPAAKALMSNDFRPDYRNKQDSDVVRVRTFNLDQVRILNSPFKHAMELDQKYMLELDPNRLLVPFYKAAGIPTSYKQYKGWETSSIAGHTLGHYLSALSMMYAASGNKQLLDRVEFIISQLEKCQQANGNGYAGGIPNGKELWNKIEKDTIEAKPFSLDGVWSPWYNLHKTFAGLRDAYLYTGNEQAKSIMIKFADWAVNLSHHLTGHEFQKMIRTEYGGMNEVMADIYSITGKKKYLDLAERFNDKRIFGPLEQGVDSLAGLHVNTQLPKIIGAAREYEVDGNPAMGKVALYFWREVTGKRIYVNGEMGDHEYFGKLGTLPERINKSTGETCNVYNMLKLTRHLMEWQPKATYAGYYERALYNDILASQDPETGMMTYFISLQPGFFKTFSQPYDSFWCCVGTGMENHAKYGKAIYLHSDTDLYINLFIPSVLTWKGKGLTLHQVTNFPDSQKSLLLLSLRHEVQLVLHVRRPSWAGAGFTIKINGFPVRNIGKPGSYIAISRKWKNGDKIGITLPMRLHIEPMANDKNKVAIMDGPIVLAGELGGYIPFPYAKENDDFFNMPTVQVPSLAIRNKPLSDWLKPVPGKPLHFKTVGVGRPDDVELEPFYLVDHQHYTVYWNVVNGD